MKMREIEVCEPCCGSCGYFGEYTKDHGCNRLKIAEVYARDEACKGYIPRKKMKVFVEENEE
jgi:hypothetical protein